MPRSMGHGKNSYSNGLECLSAQEKFSGGGWWVVGGRPNLVLSPGPGLWSLVLGPFGPDLGPGPGPELDNIVKTWMQKLN